MNKEIRIFFDLDGTLARFNVKNSLERFDKEIGFFKNLRAYKGIENINQLARKKDVYIVIDDKTHELGVEKVLIELEGCIKTIKSNLSTN